MDYLRYPIGKFQRPSSLQEVDISDCIREIELLPSLLSKAVEEWDQQKLDTPYRPQGWTVRQVVHHLADSHTHSYIRFKWSLTEEKPLIKAYDENIWAQLDDARTAPIDISLNMLSGLHQRWVHLLKNIDNEGWSRSFIHPETNKEIPLYVNLALYAWHGKHHLKHITNLKETQGW